MTTPQMPAGWYPDPDGSGGQRYWSGHAWTEHQAQAPQAVPAPPPGASGPHTDPPPPSVPTSTPRRGGAHRADRNPSDSPAQPQEPVQSATTSDDSAAGSSQTAEPGEAPPGAEAATAMPVAPLPASSPPNAAPGVDRQLLTRYLAVCAALLAVLVIVSVYAAFFTEDSSSSIGAFEDSSAFEDPTATVLPAPPPTTTADGGWGEEPTDTAPETTAVAPTSPEPSPERSDATDGPLAFTVDTIEVTPSVSSLEFPVDKTATGEYVVVHMTVTNTSDEPATFLGTFQKLIAEGTVYSIDDEATFYAGGALAELSPGDQAEVAVVYDVPPGTDPEVIELRADPLSPGVEVSLP
ncbi:MAG: DUF4352 domain-containing protein [Actinomycetia bacterium]|nr:DUF4352 domain-containing protein [Actinomycetes bacterium]